MIDPDDYEYSPVPYDEDAVNKDKIMPCPECDEYGEFTGKTENVRDLSGTYRLVELKCPQQHLYLMRVDLK